VVVLVIASQKGEEGTGIDDDCHQRSSSAR
jgi:hypothetical protein